MNLLYPLIDPQNIIKILFHIHKRKVSSFSMSLYQFALNMRYIFINFLWGKQQTASNHNSIYESKKKCIAFSHNMYSANRNTNFFFFFLYLSSECEIVHLSSDSILSVFSLKGCFYPFLIYSSQFIQYRI